MSNRHCDWCYSELEECPTCSGTRRISPGESFSSEPCRDCWGTGLQCPQHGRLWASLLPEKEASPTGDGDYDVDFGDPNPFVVPSAWLDQLSSINWRLGEQGTLHEESE